MVRVSQRCEALRVLAQAHFSSTQLHRVDSLSMLRMLREEKGVDWDASPPFFKWGTYLKKEQYEITGFNPKTQQEVRRLRPAWRPPASPPSWLPRGACPL